MEQTNTSKLSIGNPSFHTFNTLPMKNLKKPNILKYISQTDRSLNNKSSSLSSRLDRKKQKINELCFERSPTQIRQMLQKCKSIQQGIKFTRDQLINISLSPSLQIFKAKHDLTRQKVQIKYVNTLKKLKKTSEKLGCKGIVTSFGYKLQNSKDKLKASEDQFYYNFGKQFNRYFKKKLVHRAQKCSKQSKSFQQEIGRQVKEMKDAIKMNQLSHSYKDYTQQRMQAYIKRISHLGKKIPPKLSTNPEQSFVKRYPQLKSPIRRKSSNDSLSIKLDQNNFVNIPDSPINQTKNTTSSKWSAIFQQYQEDIKQFYQICEFFEKIQHQMLRYMPNNHLSNKINSIISQVQHSKAIREIYDLCNTDIDTLDPKNIVAYLKKEEGILSSMNYIVNVIKLNISAERRQRFKDLQKTLDKYQSMTIDSALRITSQLKTIDNQEMKNSINNSVKKASVSCRGLDDVYLKFVRQAEEQEFSAINASSSRNIICDILKYESMMR